MIYPGAMLGILGGGQLGRMFTHAAQAMGYPVTVLDPDPASPAGAVAQVHLQADYADGAALAQLAATCAAVTTEFENVPAASLATLSARCVVSPAADAVAVAQDRVAEKAFFGRCGLGVAPYAVIHTEADLSALPPSLFPAIMKRARFGYDGKGQVPVADVAAARAAWQSLGAQCCVLEQRIDLACELSVVVARAADGATRVFPVAENQHRHGILDVSMVPARVAPALAEQAAQAAVAIATTLQYCGVLAVEFFVTRSGGLLVNEMAPRPHNSGHYTLDACVNSQFEQQVRALCGLPLGDTQLLMPAVMVNILGEAWTQGVPEWSRVFACATAKLHLYGKQEPRHGRKMGHYTVMHQSLDTALSEALAIRAALYPQWQVAS